MDAGAERDVRVRLTVEAEGVRLVEDARVAVRRTEDEAQLGASRHPSASDLDVVEHPALEQLQRRVEPHQFLDRGRQQ